MPCVRLPSHLHRSPYGVYHFRLVLPAALAEAAGTREIWRSLRTKDPVRATLLAYSLNIRFKMLLMAKPTVQDLLKLTQDEFQQLTIKRLQVGGFRAESVHLDNSTPEPYGLPDEHCDGRRRRVVGNADFRSSDRRWMDQAVVMCPYRLMRRLDSAS